MRAQCTVGLNHQCSQLIFWNRSRGIGTGSLQSHCKHMSFWFSWVGKKRLAHLKHSKIYGHTPTHTHTHYPLQSALTMGWQVAAGWTLPRDGTKHFWWVCVCVSLESVKVCWIWIIRDKQKRPWGDWRWEGECSVGKISKKWFQWLQRVPHLVSCLLSNP